MANEKQEKKVEGKKKGKKTLRGCKKREKRG